MPEFPVARGNDVFADVVLFMLRFQAQISLNPDAQLFLRINLTPAMIATPARSVALILRTLRNRA